MACTNSNTRERSSIEIEIAALEALEKAISSGEIDTRFQERESVAERLYIVLNQYEEENSDLRIKLQIAEEEITTLRQQVDQLQETIDSLFQRR
jgi:predicted  nucleic acid-binding Zn-ribbon protein